jgi:ferredoxin-NADP reductase
MATSKRARLVRASQAGPQGRIMQFEAEEELGFAGGQYVIVQTGVVTTDGKTVKRAYSISSSDASQRSFELAVRPIENGPGSKYMASLPVGADLAFSGPWGKFLIAPETASEPVTVLATDTGITAALGIVGSSRLARHAQRIPLVWLTAGDSYFLSESEVRARVNSVPAQLHAVRVPVGQPDRDAWWHHNHSAVLDHVFGCKPAKVYLSGDGQLLASIRDALRGSERPPEVVLETFFHHQAVKQPA